MEDKIDKFCEYFYKHFTQGTWYLHFFNGLNFGIQLLNVDMEFLQHRVQHKNKYVKKGIFHSTKKENYLKVVLRKMQLRNFHFAKSEHNKRNFTCSACRQQCHQKTISFVLIMEKIIHPG